MADHRKDEDVKGAPTKKSSKSQRKGPITLKKQFPKSVKAGNWQDGSILELKEKKRSASKTIPNGGAPPEPPSPDPVVNQLDEDARDTFPTGRPLEDPPDLQQCKHCKKNVLRTAAKEHIAACLRVKKEKAQRKKEAREARERVREAERKEELRKNGGTENGANGDAGAVEEDSGDEDEAIGGGAAKKTMSGNAGKTTSKKVGGKKTDGALSGKKRKAEGEAEKAPKSKKKKDEPKKTGGAKPKGPVDVERQCGVILPNGQPCARSLTCKSHSMGAKRAVPGRSLPYDMLLAAYQKKNQAKQQKAAIDASAPLEEEDDPTGGNVDSDEETAAVMNALANWRPQPIVPQPVFAPIKREYQLARLHEQLQTATNGGRLSIFKVVGYGAQRLPDGHPGLYENEDAPGEPDTAVTGVFSRRSSSFSAMSAVPTAPPQRQPSISSRA